MPPAATATTVLPAGPVMRKKFATPPVKIACLACRASRTRCNGGQPCANCETRSRECVYQPSRRGGARVRRKKSAGPPRPPSEDDATAHPVQDLDGRPQVPQAPISLDTYIDAGAGLAQLQDWPLDSDFIFDSLFRDGVPATAVPSLDNTTPDFPVLPLVLAVPMVRTYTSNDTILDAYYIFIHPYFPILPPPSAIPVDQPMPQLQNHFDEFDDHFESSSPLGLAISAILALIPCPEDLNHLAQDSVVFRRKYSHFLAQAAVEAIESETEIPESSIEPAKALEAADEPQRMPFHPDVPLELESIVALNLLSVYEYAQRGNLKKMQTRAGQAMMSAMAMSLHVDASEDRFSEARRRVWWMTYVCSSQTAVVCNSKSTFDLVMHNFTTKFPTVQPDPEAFFLFIQAQDALLTASDFSLDLKEAVETKTDMTPIYQRMEAMECLLEPLESAADAWVLSSTTTSPVDPTEDVLSRSLRCMSRVKLSSARVKVHRYCAFTDQPLFYGKHCDLKPLPPAGSDDGDNSTANGNGAPHPQGLNRWPACSCSSTFAGGPHPQPDLLAPCDTVSPAPPTSPSSTFPFSGHQSARICLRSSLALTSAYENLPYPNPTGLPWPGGLAPCLSPTSAIPAPRTMPNFACCAMQCAYSLLMVHQKTAAVWPGTQPQDGGEVLVGSLLVMLQGGLASILGTLENYATAFEALGGMRDQIRIAIDTYVNAGPVLR